MNLKKPKPQNQITLTIENETKFAQFISLENLDWKKKFSGNPKYCT